MRALEIAAYAFTRAFLIAAIVAGLLLPGGCACPGETAYESCRLDGGSHEECHA